MAKFVVLFNWTDQGIHDAKDTIDRAQKATSAFKEKFDVTITQIYWTVGPYDLIALVDAPSVETLSAALLFLGKSGNVRSQTLRAFDAAEMQQILDRAG